MATQAECAVGVDLTPASSRPVHGLVTEASASGLLAVLVLTIHGRLGNVIIEGAADASIVFVLMASLRAQLSPIVTFVRIGRDELSPDQGAACILAQLAGSAVGGFLAGVVSEVAPPNPSLITQAALLEGVVAIAVLMVAVIGARRPRVALCVIPVLVGVACVAGSTWLGNPLLVIGAAFGATVNGSIAQIGPVLLVQTVASLLGALIVVAFRSGKRDDRDQVG